MQGKLFNKKISPAPFQKFLIFWLLVCQPTKLSKTIKICLVVTFAPLSGEQRFVLA